MRRHGVVVCFVFVFLAVSQVLNGEPKGTKISSPDPAGEVIRIASGICPQNRKTWNAPARYLKKKNPLPDSPENIKEGKLLYYKEAKPTACGLCHGLRGNGNGRLAKGLTPPPRNFTCAELMDAIPDGQLFWIIKNGSRGTAMPVHKETLSDNKIWQLVRFIRQFAN
ncbi:MAG: c-type cytochrome [Nitrospinae bacterium]|nr:c-type cytochrome [Nitrospinota bacterium]